jgi:prepilin-type processing-associated H-X9-DG protein
VICRITGDHDYQWVIPVADKGYLKIWAMLNQRPGQRVGENWVPPRVYLWDGDDPPPLWRADMPWFAGGALVVTPRAREVLGEVLGDDAEMLPLRHDGEDLWLVNPWRQVDALDEENSEIKRFPSTGRVMGITRYAFKEDMIKGLSCFTIPQLRNVMFVDGSVADAAQRTGLAGVIFPPA